MPDAGLPLELAPLSDRFSARRPIDWLYCEGEEVVHRMLTNRRMAGRKLANKDGHGRWLEWL